MTASDFTAFTALMKQRGISAAHLCRLLGCGNNQVRRWRDNGAPEYVGLACAALAFGLPAWKAKS